jgi:hypothetical protein
LSLKYGCGLLQTGFALAAGFHYSRENYHFEKPEPPATDIPLFSSIEDKSLQTIGGAIYIAKPLRGNKYILLRVSGDLNGDYHMNGYSKTSFLQFNIAPVFGWKRNENLSYGIGVTYGNILAATLSHQLSLITILLTNTGV